MPKFKKNMLPEKDRKYYDSLSDSDKEILNEEYPRVYLQDGTLDYIPEDRYYLAKGIYWEAEESGISDEDREAVGWVIRNRRDDEHEGATTYEEVLTTDNQFSSRSKIEDDDLLREKLENPYERKSWEKSVQTATEVDNAPEDSDPTNGADHFYSPKRQSTPPDWADVYEEETIDGGNTNDFRFFNSDPDEEDEDEDENDAAE